MEQYLKIFKTNEDYESSSEKGLYNHLIDSVELEKYVDPYAGHEFVEIGGVKWATMNIGASSATDYGLYFQWGDTQGYASSEVGSGDGKKYFGWADYKYCSGASTSSSAMTKYNSGDNKTVLDAEDDAARANWGGIWRMPTEEEYIALGAATTSAHTRINNVNGVMLTSKTDSSKKLFFPFTGRCGGGTWYSGGIYGSYWSSSLYSDNTKSYQITFGISYVHLSDSNIRMQGCSIRPVAS